MTTFAAVPLAFLLSALSIRFLSIIAPAWGLVDKPGGHKLHEDHVPIVGGLGIFLGFAAVIPLLISTGNTIPYAVFTMATLLLLVAGLYDDVWQLRARVRFVAQGGAAMLMVLSGGVVLTDLGHIISSELLVLGVLAVPMTVFATIGTINALNMVDGIDGLAGSLSFVILGFLAIVAGLANRFDYLLLILTMMGAVSGFLVFNLRYRGRVKAAVFMGDAGSTVLGFAFAWFFIVLSQGEGRAMAPVTALWLFGLPLFETITAILRRGLSKRSLFAPDHFHMHHLLKDAGFRITHIVLVIICLQLILGSIGLIGLYQGVPEAIMFYGFLGVFLFYFSFVCHPWTSVCMFRRWYQKLGFEAAGVSEIFIGNLHPASARETVDSLLGKHAGNCSYHLFSNYTERGQNTYAVLDVGSSKEVKNMISYLSNRQKTNEHLVIRQFIPRSPVKRRSRKLPVYMRNYGFSKPRSEYSTAPFPARQGDRRKSSLSVVQTDDKRISVADECTSSTDQRTSRRSTTGDKTGRERFSNNTSIKKSRY